MSSSTTTTDSCLLNRITGYISHIQQKQIFTKQRLNSIRQVFCQSIGFLILLYFFIQIPIFIYSLLKFLFRILAFIIWLPLQIIQLFLPKTINYTTLFLLFASCSILAFFLAKLSYKNICYFYDLYQVKRLKFLRRYLFILTFIIFLLLQSLFIILPIALSIRPSSAEIVDKQILLKSIEIIKNISQEKFLPLHDEQEANDHMDSVEQFDLNTVDEKSNLQKQESLIFYQRLNNWFDEAWKFRYQIKRDFGQLFSLSTKHSRHLPRYNDSSIYTAYTDLSCYDYTKLSRRYGLLKSQHVYFLNNYRSNSPFPVYLSILISNGPKCYQYYPNSSCAHGSISFLTQPWLILTILIIFLAILYKGIIYRQKQPRFNRSSNKSQQLPSTQINALSSQQTPPLNTNTNNLSLDKRTQKQLYSWLEREQNDGYRNISEACRIALNDLLLIQNERLTVETLQFTNAKILNISHDQSSLEKIIINAILDIDHLMFNIRKEEQHYSIGISKLTSEVQVLLAIDNNQCSIEVKFKQIQIDSENMSDEKQSIVKLLKEAISQIIVQYSFYLSDNYDTIVDDSSSVSKAHPSASQLSSSIPTNALNKYQQSESPPIVPITDNNPQQDPEKKLLVRVVKAVKLHDVEHPFCVLELNQPKQIHQTTIAQNGLNPFWDEHFLFDCNDKSNRIRLQLIDRKNPNKKISNNIIDTIYADVSIPFSYVTSTIYKQDVQITPQYPDSIIRIEFSTLSEEEALAANNGYDIESITDSQNWSCIGREINKIEHDYRQSPSDGIVSLSSNKDLLPKDYVNNASTHFRPTTNTISTSSQLTSHDNDSQVNKSQKSRSFMSSLKHLTFSRRKHNRNKDKQNDNSAISQLNSTTESSVIPHSLSSALPVFNPEPFLTANPTSINRNHSISRSFRNFFRSSSKRKTDNFVIDHRDPLSTPTPTPKKFPFFRRRRSKQPTNISINSLTSYDCPRKESVRNTPVRANVGHPVTMTKSPVQ